MTGAGRRSGCRAAEEPSRRTTAWKKRQWPTRRRDGHRGSDGAVAGADGFAQLTVAGREDGGLGEATGFAQLAVAARGDGAVAEDSLN